MHAMAIAKENVSVKARLGAENSENASEGRRNISELTHVVTTANMLDHEVTPSALLPAFLLDQRIELLVRLLVGGAVLPLVILLFAQHACSRATVGLWADCNVRVVVDMLGRDELSTSRIGAECPIGTGELLFPKTILFYDLWVEAIGAGGNFIRCQRSPAVAAAESVRLPVCIGGVDSL